MRTVAVVAGRGLSLLIAASARQPAVVLAGMVLGGLAYAPYPVEASTLLQDRLAGEELVAAAAAWTTVTLLAAPVGTLAGGPIVAAVGAQPAMLGSVAGTLVLAAVAAMVVRLRGTVPGSQLGRRGRGCGMPPPSPAPGRGRLACAE